MKLAILEAGTPPGPLTERFGRYPAMFERLLGNGIDYDSFDVPAGELPGVPGDHDAYLVTGSACGVYDTLPWISELAAFLRAAGTAKLVGICFGHQIMAEAFGGRVEKGGQRLGRRPPQLSDRQARAVDGPGPDRLGPRFAPGPGRPAAAHTDVIASSIFTPYAGLAWHNKRAISFQFHPEFEPDYAKALIEYRRERLPDPDGAIASLDRPNDNERVGMWIRNFLLS
jgi:GMP synthase-like glutamine amidotransferase